MKKKEYKHLYKNTKKQNQELIQKNAALLKENEYYHKIANELAQEKECLRSMVLEAQEQTALVMVNHLSKELEESTQESNAIEIDAIDFSEDVTTIHWNDGIDTSVKRAKGEKNDANTAVAYAIVKRILGGRSLASVVRYYQEDHSKDERYVRIYQNLNSESPIKRMKAQKAWSKIPESKRQAAKARAHQFE